MEKEAWVEVAEHPFSELPVSEILLLVD